MAANQEFMTAAGKLRTSLVRMEDRIRVVLKEKTSQSLFDEDEEEQVNDIIFKIKDELNMLPSNIESMLEKGAKAGVQKEIVVSISHILNNEMLEIGMEYRRLLEKRCNIIKTKEDKKNKLNNTGVGDKRNSRILTQTAATH